MRKFKIYAFVAAVMAATSLTSCSLDIEPTTAIDTDKAQSDPVGQVKGLFNLMQGVSYYGRNMVIMGDVGTDIVAQKGTSGRFQLDYNMMKNAFSSIGVSDDYDGLSTYQRISKVIVNANMALANANVKDDLRAQAHFVRALAYADMVKLYGQVPLVLETPAQMGKPENFMPAKKTEAEIYAQVYKDLDAAAAFFKATPAPVLKGKSYASADAVVALRARVVLQHTELLSGAEREQALERVVANVDSLSAAKYAFVTGSDRAYYEYFQGDNGSETIFELKFTQNQGRGSNNFGHLYHYEGYGEFTAPTIFASTFTANDMRAKVFKTGITTKDKNGNIVEWPGLFYVHKFDVHEKNVGMHSPKLLRYAEALLNKAEALAALGRGSEAAAIVNTIEAARAIDKSNAPVLTTAGVDEVLEARKKELAFEGHRMFDLRRNKKSVTLYSLDKGGQTTKPVVRGTVPAGDKQFWFPIPADELMTNLNMTQNHDY